MYAENANLWYKSLPSPKDKNFPCCGISAKIAEIMYKAENDVLNKMKNIHA